jgi:hypothetical protein
MVQRISPCATALLQRDVNFLADFVSSLDNPVLRENLDELVQTVALMRTESPDEFFDVSQANRKYGRVDRANGAILLEKVREGAAAVEAMQRTALAGMRGDTFANLGARFGINRG